MIESIRGLTVTDRMQTPIRIIVPGLLLAFSAMAVRAQSNSPEAAPTVGPAAAQPSTPLNLSPPASPPSAPLNLSPPMAASPPSAPLNLSPPMAASPPSAPLNLATPATAAPPSAPLNLATPAAAAPAAVPAEVALQSASAEVKRVARWVTDSRDNGGMPFLLIDKVNAQVYAFNRTGQLLDSAPALLGMAHGDRLLAPNDATMSQMPPQVRITPAGRFVSRLAIDSHGKELLVLDYDASISLHPVVKGTPAEHRAERLKSATSKDNRISFGCINVPAAFYSTTVSPSFTQTKGIVYVLPETSPASKLFGFEEAVSAAQAGSTALNASAAQPASAPVAN